MTNEDIARVCHEANTALSCAIGELAVHWESAPDWQKDSAIRGVEWRIAHPAAPEDAQHEAWRQDKTAEGWVYGLTKDADQKTHPCMVPFAELPPEQQAKDRLFVAIVTALTERVV